MSDLKDSKRALLERIEQRIIGGESKEDGDMEDGDPPKPWSCLAREVYPPLINHPCLLDPAFELNKQPIDDVMDPPTRFDAFLDAEQGEKLESMDLHNSKRHERMLWRLVGEENDIESDGVSQGEEEGLQKRGALKWMFRPAGGAIKSQPYVNTSDEESDGD
jgi:hypothetical protein